MTTTSSRDNSFTLQINLARGTESRVSVSCRKKGLKGEWQGDRSGLSIVYSIVKKYNGFVDVESAAGKGSTFRLDLPQ